MPSSKKRSWVSLVPYGLNQQHPNAYKDILDTVWENRDNLGYAWRILSDGCCDGCALGTSGMHDWTMKGIHLCAVRLQLLRLNTMPAMDWRAASKTWPGCAARREKQLRKLGRLPVPMVRRKGEKGFRRVSWDEAIALSPSGCASIDPQAPGLVPDLARAHQRGLLRPPESRALSRHQPRRYQRAHLPCAQHLGFERHGGLRRHHLLLLGLDRRRPGGLVGTNLANNQPVATKYLLLRQEGRHQDLRGQSLSRAGPGSLLGAVGDAKARCSAPGSPTTSSRSMPAATSPSSTAC